MSVQHVYEHLRADEGFRAKPYQCPTGHWTIGHGLTYLTEPESEYILQSRAAEAYETVAQPEFVRDAGPWPEPVREVLAEMVYQMGRAGLLYFRRALAALRAKDYEAAAVELLDSKWARQTPGRAQRAADRIRACGGPR